ncbi:DUF6961 family protein [Sphingomonas baiyangensis]|uniref:Uncharacterized protein n=1 Tax=Sphingomonas baiyangensis TaxID=2572576 RepID=A0A4U1L3S2_9SPHN|nr:hypothetical protein [Sphingomonas baiyangensis]TKD51551.1 hypothetical protein FBR43_12890 [Sphingomonas baiyangensis]
MAISDWEVWACALNVERVYGEKAMDHIEERMKDLSQAGDNKGLLTWLRIADCLDDLRLANRTPH